MEIAELEVRVSSAKAKKDADALKRSLRDTGKEGERAGAKASSGISRIGPAAMTAGSALKRLLLAAVGLRTIFGAMRTIADFERTMSGVRAVTQATAEEMSRLTFTAREMGARTVFSASQAAEGMEALGLAGFKTNQIIAAIPGTLQLAAAGSLGLGQASGITADVLSGFNLSAGEAGRVADVLAVSATNANQTVADLGDSMKFVGPVARSLGVGLEETAAAVSILANAGIRGGEAGTGLRMVMLSLIKPSKEALDVLAGYGLTADQVNPTVVGLTGALQNLANASITVTDSAKLFEARAFSSYQILSSKIGGIKAMKELADNAAGAAERMAAIRLDNLIGDWQLFKSALEEVTLASGEEGLRGSMRATVQSMTRGIQGLNNNWETLRITAKSTWRDIANAAGSAMEFIGSAASTIWDALKIGWVGVRTSFQVVAEVMTLAWSKLFSFILSGIDKVLAAAANMARFVGMNGAAGIAESARSGLTGPMATMAVAGRNATSSIAGLDAGARAEADEILRRGAEYRAGLAQGFNADRMARNSAVAKAEAGRINPFVPDTATTPGGAVDASEGGGAGAVMADRFGVIGSKFSELQSRWHSLAKEINSTDFLSKATVEDVQAKADEIAAIGKEIERRFRTNAVGISEAFSAGFQAAVLEFGTFKERVASIGGSLASSIDNNLTDSLMGLIDGTMSVQEAFHKMSMAIIQDLIRVMIQQLVVRSLMSGLGLGAGVAHQGGVVGSQLPLRSAGMDDFRGASRFEGGGFAGDEVPIIAHRGEVILNEDQMGQLSGNRRQPRIDIINVTDPSMIDERIAANPSAILNVISKHRQQVRGALGMA